jgi:hypothetical protein
MEISMGLAEALARFAYVQTHQAETSDADRQKAARDLASRVREEGPLNSMSGPSGLGATAGIPRIDVTQTSTDVLQTSNISV